jgi:hypothetical protein
MSLGIQDNYAIFERIGRHIPSHRHSTTLACKRLRTVALKVFILRKYLLLLFENWEVLSRT